MKILKLLPLLLFFLAHSIVNAQTYSNQTANGDLDGFQNKTSELSFLSAQNQQNFFRNAAASNNNVFINQIGDGNNSSVTAKSSTSDINILQNGSDNDLYIDISAKTIQQTIVQNGDNNNILHTNPFKLESHNSQILQNGNNQNLEWFGGNSVSEKMKVTMQGENQSVIIRSFN